MADSSRTPPAPTAMVDLDLAFTADGPFAPELVEAAGPWADPLAAAELWHRLLESWLALLAGELPPELQAPAYSLGLSLVGDAEIAALNAEWRHRSGPTDVLAFAARDNGPDGAPPLPLPPGPSDNRDDQAGEVEPLELGDIVISVATAARQAADHTHSLKRELHVLASHGLLHLLGWDHPDEAALEAMLARQEQLLAGR